MCHSTIARAETHLRRPPARSRKQWFKEVLLTLEEEESNAGWDVEGVLVAITQHGIDK